MSFRILKLHVPSPSVALMLLEAAIAVASLFFVTLRWGTELPQDELPGWRTSVFFACMVVLASSAMGLYNLRLRAHLFGLAMRFALMAMLVLVAIVLALKAFPVSRFSILDYVYALVLTISAALVTRFLLGHMVRDGFLKTRVLVYGAGQRAECIAKLRRRSDRIGFTVVGYAPSNGESRNIPESLIVDVGDDLLGFCEREHIDEIIVAMDDRRQSFPLRDLLHCRIKGIDVLELVGFLERETGAVRLDVVNPSWMIFSPGFRRSLATELFDRVFDITASMVALAVAWPLMLLAALAIKLEGGIHAPVLYRQQRVGKDGRTFCLLKFRSMKLDAEADGVARWASESDTRVTRVGAFLRPSRIDELPQLWNILRGDMRFVGPRPERPEFVSAFVENLPYYAERHSVRPGLTGWAQLCFTYGSSEQDAQEKLKYDLYYIKNHSLVFDLAILIQTVEVILFGRGAR